MSDPVDWRPIRRYANDPVNRKISLYSGGATCEGDAPIHYRIVLPQPPDKETPYDLLKFDEGVTILKFHPSDRADAGIQGITIDVLLDAICDRIVHLHHGPTCSHRHMLILRSLCEAQRQLRDLRSEQAGEFTVPVGGVGERIPTQETLMLVKNNVQANAGGRVSHRIVGERARDGADGTPVPDQFLSVIYVEDVAKFILGRRYRVVLELEE